MHFGNFKYLAYIAATSGLVLIFWVLYLIWKRRVMTHLGLDALVRGSRRLALARAALVGVAIVLAAFTLLRPQWGERAREVKSEGSDVLIALDVSPSMLARDADPSRLERAKAAVRWIVESLKGDRIGMILFSGDAFLQCPLTNDYGAFMMFLDAANPDAIRLRGTDIGRALRESKRVFEKKRLTSRILIIITDGEDNEGDADEAAALFRSLDVSIFAVGVGRESGEVIPAPGDDGESAYYRDPGGSLVKTRKRPDLLKRLAGMTGGGYIDITNDLSGLRRVLDIIADQQKNQYGSRVVREPQERYQPFVLLLLLILAVELMLPERRGVGAGAGTK